MKVVNIFVSLLLELKNYVPLIKDHFSVLGNADLINRILLDAGFTNELVQNYWSKQKNM